MLPAVSLLPILICYFGFIFGFSYYLKSMRRLAPWLTTTSILVTIYGCARAGLLPLGIYLVHAIGIGLAFLFFIKKAQKQVDWDTFKHPTTLSFFVGISLGFVFTRGSELIWFDEFSHWGLKTKEMLELKGLLTADSQAHVKEYPIGGNVFQIFHTFIGPYSEANILFANYILLLSPLTVAFNFSLKKRFKETLALSILFMTYASWKLGVSYQTIYMDTVTAANFFALLYSHAFIIRKRMNFIWLMIPLFALVQLKTVGIVLALAFCGYFLLDVCVTQAFHPTFRRRLSAWLKPILLLILFLAAIGSSKVSWDTYVKKLNIKSHFATEFLKTDDFSDYLAQKNLTEHQATVQANFGEALVKKPFAPRYNPKPILNYALPGQPIPNLSFLAWFILLVSIIALTGSFERQFPRHRLIVFLLFFGGFTAAYLFMHLVLYIFSFSTYEGVHLASFSRYLSVILFPLFLFTFFLSFRKARIRYGVEKANKGAWMILGALVLFQTPRPAPFPWDRTKARKQLHNEIQFVQEKTPKESRIFLITQGDSGFTHSFLRYELSPRTLTWVGTLTLKQPKLPWEARKRPNQLREILADHQFLMVIGSAQEFFDMYGSTLNITDSEANSGAFLYKVTKSEAPLDLAPVVTGN